MEPCHSRDQLRAWTSMTIKTLLSTLTSIPTVALPSERTETLMFRLLVEDMVMTAHPCMTQGPSRPMYEAVTDGGQAAKVRKLM